MRTIIALAVAIATLAATAPTADACSARGRFCSYPAWAANAFEDNQGRAPVSAILPKSGGTKRKTR